MSRNVSGVAMTTAARTTSSRPYSRRGRRTRSATGPPMNAPIAIPPKNPVRMADTACVVLPKTRTSWRDQTISSISPAAPDRTKISRMTIGTDDRPVPSDVASDAICPVDPREHDHDAEQDQDPPAQSDRSPGRRRARAQGDDEWDRIERIPVAVLEPAAAVVEERRDQDRDGGRQQQPGAGPSPVRPDRVEQPRAGQEDRQPEAVGLEERRIRDQPRQMEEHVVHVHRDMGEREQAERA